jgi:hypothetical protein
MVRYDDQLPALLPVLSRGKHRSPRKGACFMEFASLLASERWSDHPACTHPLLAAVACHINDYTSDADRARLAELIPSVIGLTGDDLAHRRADRAGRGPAGPAGGGGRAPRDPGRRGAVL